MVEWTRDALDAAATTIYGERQTYEPGKVRAALDAAVKAQGLTDSRLYKDGYPYAKGRAEALEEAVSALERLQVDINDCGDEEGLHMGGVPEAIAAIRALKEPAKG